MKKSQMVREITNIISEFNWVSTHELATTILAKMEELGMQPPVEVVDPVLFHTTFEWEKEDET